MGLARQVGTSHVSIRRPWQRSLALGVILVPAFAVLVTANSAGYRFGVSDQAFYVPAVERLITPALFPRDRALIDSQARLTVSDDAIARIAIATGADLPTLFFLGFLLTAVVFAVAVLAIGSRYYASPWTSAALLLALTFRHRLLETGVNSFEGYFHPRVLAFAVGLAAVAACLGGRRIAALTLAAAAFVVHPTTGGWFIVWIAVALGSLTAHRWRVAAGAAVVGLLGILTVWIVAPDRFATMDAAWLEVLRSRRYLFTTEWSLATWVVDLLPAVALIAGFTARARQGLVAPAERGVFAGAMALLAIFVLTLPFVAAHVALAIQLQISRVFWPIELLTTVYIVWAVAEGPWLASLRARTVPMLLVFILAAGSAARGGYILAVETHRPLARLNLPDGDWQRVATWARTSTPVSAHFLIDPTDLDREGVSFRVTAARDVFIEPSKDPSIAMYSRDIAMRVRERQAALPDFSLVTSGMVRDVSARYGLTHLVTVQEFPFTPVFRSGRLKVYSLAANETVVRSP